MYGYIYKTTYLGDKRIYVGQRRGSFKHSYLGSGKHLKLAIKKYGKQNFWVELLAYAQDQIKLDHLEKYYITLYRNALGRDNLFNISGGGLDERSFKGELNPMFGSHRVGSANPNWRNGACLKKYYCSDCGKQIYRDSLRCKSCVGKLRDKDKFVRMAKLRGAPWNKGLTKGKDERVAKMYMQEVL